MSHKKSPIDNLFYQIYGYYPTKAGEAYELLVAAALKILFKNNKIGHNQFIKGKYSEQTYQIDGTNKSNKKNQIIEAKDYTISDEKVGRPDVQKLEGALVDLEFDSGVFSSATDYTRNAKKYAEGTKKNPITKDIELYNIRPSTKKDEEGRIMEIQIDLVAKTPEFEKGQFKPILTDKGKNVLLEIYEEGDRIQIKLETIFNSDGTIYTTIRDWISSFEFSSQDQADVIEGRWELINKFIKIKNKMVEIEYIDYRIPIAIFNETIKVTPNGKAKLLVKNEDGDIDTLIAEGDLRRVKFDDDLIEYK